MEVASAPARRQPTCPTKTSTILLCIAVTIGGRSGSESTSSLRGREGRLAVHLMPGYRPPTWGVAGAGRGGTVDKVEAALGVHLQTITVDE